MLEKVLGYILIYRYPTILALLNSMKTKICTVMVLSEMAIGEITSPDFGISRPLLNILLRTSSVVSKANQTIKTLQSFMSYCTIYLLVDTTVGLRPSSSGDADYFTLL